MAATWVMRSVNKNTAAMMTASRIGTPIPPRDLREAKVAPMNVSIKMVKARAVRAWIDQSRARSGGKQGNKGTEAAVTALQMVALNKAHDGSGGTPLGF